MKIYISVDLEGISGVSSPEYVLRDGFFYPTAQRLLTADVNAAVRGAFDGGADEVVVIDGHSGGKNFLPGELDVRAVQITGDALTQLDADAVFMILLGAATLVTGIVMLVKRKAIFGYLKDEWMDRRCLKWFFLNSGTIVLLLLMAANSLLLLVV